MIIYRKKGKDEELDKKTGLATHVALRPTHSPIWEEMLTLNVDGKKTEDESKYIT